MANVTMASGAVGVVNGRAELLGTTDALERKFAGLLRGLAQCDGATPRALVAEGKAGLVTNRR